MVALAPRRRRRRLRPLREGAALDVDVIEETQEPLISCFSTFFPARVRRRRTSDVGWCTTKFFKPLASHTTHLYLCFATQMALLGFFIEIYFQSDYSVTMAFP